MCVGRVAAKRALPGESRSRPEALDQNPQSRVDRAAAPQESGCEVKVDVRTLGEGARHLALVPGALKLLQTPGPHALGLFLPNVELDFRRRILVDLSHTSTFVLRAEPDVPPRRDIRSE